MEKQFIHFIIMLPLPPDGEARTLSLMPNKSWPAVVYYNSWTGRNMGWKIHVLDMEEQVITASRLMPSAASRQQQQLSITVTAVLLATLAHRML